MAATQLPAERQNAVHAGGRREKSHPIEQDAVQCDPGLALFAESNSEPICFVCFGH
jgi:hypothetical protein